MPTTSGGEALAIIADDIAADVRAAEADIDGSTMRVTILETALSPRPDVGPAE